MLTNPFGTAAEIPDVEIPIYDIVPRLGLERGDPAWLTITSIVYVDTVG